MRCSPAANAAAVSAAPVRSSATMATSTQILQTAVAPNGAECISSGGWANEGIARPGEASVSSGAHCLKALLNLSAITMRNPDSVQLVEASGVSAVKRDAFSIG